MAKFRRRITLIKKDLQFNMVIAFIILGGAISTATFAVSRIFFTSFKGQSISTQAVALTEAKIFFVSIILVAFFSYIFGIWSSHKIAGPLYRVEKVLETLRSGDLSATVHIRKADFLHETAEVFNKAVGGLREKAQDARGRLDEARDIIESLEKTSDDDRKEQLGKIRDLVEKASRAFVLSSGEKPSADSRV